MEMQNGRLVLRFNYPTQPTDVIALTRVDVIVNETEATHTWTIEATAPVGYTGPVCIGVLLGPRP
jgi:hypothetical protein